jgi:zinc/manganese transport system permease protein
MTDAWVAGTVVAVIAGVVGYFVVLRGAAFAAHAIPKGAFAGAAGASLLGLDTLLGLGVFSALGALAIGLSGRRGRHDVVTALVLVFMLALGALFLSRTTEYEPEVLALLFGQVLGVSRTELLPVVALAAMTLLALALIYRPLVLASVLPEAAAIKGIRPERIEMSFLLLLAAATAVTLPIVGALLIFSLMTGPPAAARTLARRPPAAIGLSVAIAVVCVWTALASSYATNWPVGFWVGTLSASAYGLSRGWAASVARVARRREAKGPTGAEASAGRGAPGAGSR